jgi:8-oxo-dGTP diphosphatase
MATNTSTQIDVVAGLIFRDGRVLVCQRRDNSAFPLKWEFPGGKVEKTESDSEALWRELKEELGIDVLESLQVYQNEHSYADGPMVHLRFFKILKYQGEPKNLVFQQITWVELPQLVGLDFLEGDKPLIDKLAKSGGTEFLW